MMRDSLSSVLFSQVSLRRNYQDLTFCPQNVEPDLQESRRRTLHRISQLQEEFKTILPEAGQVVHKRYQQRGLLPAQFGNLQHAALAINEAEDLFFRINLEEHLVISHRGKVGQVKDQLRSILKMEKAISSDDHPFASHPQFGFLSFRPELAGSGLYVSLVMHLPMMSYLKQVHKAMAGEDADLVSCRLTPYMERGNRNPAKLYVLSNAKSHGLSEEDTINEVFQAASLLDQRESQLRERAVEANGDSTFSDQIWRAYGVLKHARRLGEVDYLQLWSSLRLGETAGILPIQPGLSDRMLELAFDGNRETEEIKTNNTAVRRATLVRQALHGG